MCHSLWSNLRALSRALPRATWRCWGMGVDWWVRQGVGGRAVSVQWVVEGMHVLDQPLRAQTRPGSSSIL